MRRITDEAVFMFKVIAEFAIGVWCMMICKKNFSLRYDFISVMSVVGEWTCFCYIVGEVRELDRLMSFLV